MCKTHFNNSLIYYIKLGDIKGIKDIYINLAKLVMLIKIMKWQ